MKKKGIFLILIIIVLAIVAFVVYKSMNGSNDNPKNQSGTGEKTEPVEVEKNKNSGTYIFGDEKLYLFQNDTTLYFSDGVHRGKVSITNGQASYSQYIDDKEIVYKFLINNDTLTITSDGDLFESGTYKKSGNLSLEEYFGYAFGGSSSFNSKYNGYYKNDNFEIYAYQKDAETVNVLMYSEEFSMNANFKVMNDGSLKLDSDEEQVSIQLTNEGLTFKASDEFLKELNVKPNGSYKKEKTLTMYDIMDNTFFYDYQ